MSLPQDEALRAALHAGLRGATIAFDLDGTLVDTAPDLGGALNVVLMEQGLASAPLDTVRHLVGRGARALIGRGFALAGEPLDEDRLSSLTPRFIEAYRARIAEGSRPYPNLESTLDVLAGAGARLCVCTNKRTDLSLAQLRLGNRSQARSLGTRVGTSSIRIFLATGEQPYMLMKPARATHRPWSFHGHDPSTSLRGGRR